MKRNIRKLILGFMAVSTVFMASCGLLEKVGFDREEKLPWEGNGKQPSEYTWEEFEALTQNQQMAFQYSFASEGAFDEWLQSAQPVETVKIDVPWENGGKQPEQYTWEEFENLTADQQMVFQHYFENVDAFEKWRQSVTSEPVEETTKIDAPWENGGKQPEQYTWEEFEALTADQQMIFQNYFDNVEAFDRWLQSVTAGTVEETVSPALPWLVGGKHPTQYTWEEYEQLTAEQQMAFQDCFGRIELFDQWMKRVHPDNTAAPTENTNGAVLYTWEEFENLTAEQQMIFQNSFKSIEEFDAWLQKAQADTEKTF